jgi:uncharacterized protein YbjT (DUF2867 family)
MEARTNDPPILVTGGTGTLGRLVVARLREAGRDVRVLSRGKRELPNEIKEPAGGVKFITADLATGDGVDPAVQGTETIIHLAGSAKGDEDKARHLVQAASRSGATHLVYISVVGDERIPVISGIDRAMFGYFASKLAAERAIADSGLPWTTLHATQLYDLTFLTMQAMAKLPVIPVPAGFKFQPIDAGEVADRLVGLALGAPAGLVPDMAGPRVYELAELVRSYLRAAGKRRLLIPARMPGGAARAFREGANLAPDRAVGRTTWEEFLAARVGSRSDSRPAAA